MGFVAAIEAANRHSCSTKVATEVPTQVAQHILQEWNIQGKRFEQFQRQYKKCFAQLVKSYGHSTNPPPTDCMDKDDDNDDDDDDDDDVQQV